MRALLPSTCPCQCHAGIMFSTDDVAFSATRAQLALGTYEHSHVYTISAFSFLIRRDGVFCSEIRHLSGSHVYMAGAGQPFGVPLCCPVVLCLDYCGPAGQLRGCEKYLSLVWLKPFDYKHIPLFISEIASRMACLRAHRVACPLRHFSCAGRTYMYPGALDARHLIYQVLGLLATNQNAACLFLSAPADQLVPGCALLDTCSATCFDNAHSSRRHL